MIRTLINLLGSFYESNELSKVETIARNIHTAIPGDQVSLKFLGLVYYRTGRIKDAIRLFDQVQLAHAAQAQNGIGGKEASHGDSAAEVCRAEASRRLPYLAQAWRDLGATLMELKKFELALPAFRSTPITQPSFA